MVRYLAYGTAALIFIAASAWFFRPAQYEVFALLKVERSSHGVLDKSREDREEFDIFKRTQAALVTSGPVMRNAVREPAIQALPVVKSQEDPVAWLQSQIVVDFPNEAEVMRVTIRTTHPDEATKLIDKVVEKYLSEIVMKERNERFDQEDALQKRYDRIKQEFKTRSQALFDLEQSAQAEGTAAGEMQRKLAVAELEEALVTRSYLRRELLENELQLHVQEAQSDPADEKQTANGEPAADPAVATPPPPAASDRVLESLKQQRAFLEQKLKVANEQIDQAAATFRSVDHFDASIAAGREELAAYKKLLTQIKEQIDLTQVERISRERISKIDDATAVPLKAEQTRRIATLAGATVISLGLVVVGWASGRRKRVANVQ